MNSGDVARHARAALFLAVGGWVLLGPSIPHVFLGRARTAEHPFRPMAWHMYHSVGSDLCQAAFFEMKDGVRTELAPGLLDRTIQKKSNRSKYRVGRKVRENDVLMASEADLPEMMPGICAAVPSGDVRGIVRCAPPEPGPWSTVENGTTNLCTRRWGQENRVAVPLPGEPVTPTD